MPLDYSPLLGPTPESGANKGMSFLSNVLDAVLQRRAQQEQARLQREQQEAHFNANMAWQKENAGVLEAARVRDDERAAAKDKADNARLTAEAEQKRRAAQAGAFKDSLGIQDDSAALTHLRLNGLNVRPQEVDPALLQPIEQPPPAPESTGAMSVADHDAGSSWDPATEERAEAAAREADRVAQLNAAQERVRGKYVVDMGDGTTQVMDRRAMGPEGDAERINRAATFIRDPAAAMDMRRLAPMAAAGMMKPEQAAGFVEQGVQGRRRDAAAMERARVAASGAATRKNGLSRGEEGRLMNQELSGYLERSEYKAREAEVQGFAKMAALAKTADANPKAGADAAQMFMGLYTKYAQGQVGVLTPSDMDTFWNKAGSPDDRTEAALNRLLTGQDGPEKRKRAMLAINALMGTAKARLDKIQSGAQILMEPYGADGDRLLRAHFGRGLPAQEKARAQAEADALLGGKKKGAAK